MKVGFLITARLKSKRLPLKLLLSLNGRTVIERVIERAVAVQGCEDVVLCTSTHNQDLPLVRLANDNGIYYFTGDGEDVLARLLEAAHLFGLDYIVGITADNPLFSIHHANLLVDKIRQQPELDFLYTSGLPLGTNLYAIKVLALKTVCEVKKIHDTEIWGYLINRPELFNVAELEAGAEYKADFRLTLDEIADYELISNLYGEFESEHVPDLLEVISILKNSPVLASHNSHVIQRDLDEEIKQSIDRFYKENISKIKQIKNEIYGNSGVSFLEREISYG